MSDSILHWCKSVVTISPARWQNLVNAVPLDLLTRQPSPGEWSALECLQHLVEVERDSYPGRLRALLAETSFPAFNPYDAIKPPPTLALAAEFEACRRENLAILDQITPADLDKQALHAEYGMVTMRHFLHHWAGHDLMHLVQAERALMQPFIQGCGPWDVNYTDHAVQP